MDAFERHVRSGLELAGVEVDEIDLAVMRAADAIYGPALRALGDADLVHVWEETALDPSRPPEGSTLPEPLARPAQERPPLQSGEEAHPQDLGLRQQAALVASGDLDPAELLAATLERIAERDGPINSVVDTFPEQSERMLAEAPRGPLHGVPVGVKDQFALPWRAPMDGTAREALPAGDSGVHRRLREAGAVIACVTNMHFWGGGSTGHLSAHGPCGNPWSPEHCGGGSSGGSIRLPAAYCGITGIKPTFGSVPTDGNVHGYLSMDCAGPMCRDAADTRLLGEVLTGMPLPAGDGASLRAGLVRSPFWEDLDPEVEAACRDAIAAAGWETAEIEIDHAAHAQAATVLRLTLEGMPSLEPEDIAHADPVMRALVKFELLLPAHLLVRADRVRSALRRSVAEAFGRVDVLVWPTVPAPAPRLDNPTVELPSGIVPADSANVRQAGFGNLTGIPGASVPVGLHSGGLPIGLMIQAPWGADARVLDAAEHLEDATGREFVDRAATLAAA